MFDDLCPSKIFQAIFTNIYAIMLIDLQNLMSLVYFLAIFTTFWHLWEGLPDFLKIFETPQPELP